MNDTSNTNNALVQGAAMLSKEGRFTEAYLLLRLALERGLITRSVIEACIDAAFKASMLDACADFFAALGQNHPENAEALNFASGLLGAVDRKEESRIYAKKFAARKSLFPSSVTRPRLSMLVLQSAATGDYRYSPRSKRFFMPGISDLYTLLDPAVASHRLLVDDPEAAVAALERSPSYDLVFNTISDPDYMESLENAAFVCERAGKPVINDPRRVRLLNRESLPQCLQSQPGVLAAKSLFLTPERAAAPDIAAAVRENGLAFPVIVRAPGFQGGKHMALLRGPEDTTDHLYRGNGLYVIEFIDVAYREERAPETPLYPKYRAFFVNGTLYPMHLFFADQYEVHKKTSDPVHAKYPWLIERETEFLHNPAAHLPAGRWAELHAAMEALGLDYCGVDFAVSRRPGDGGKLVLFECNPSMRNWLTMLPEGDQVQRQWHAVTLAAHKDLCAKAGVPEWDFVLKKGR